MDPVFLYVNVSRRVLTLEALTSDRSQVTSAHDEIRMELVKVAQCLPYMRRALACNLCNRVLTDPVLVLECLHWSCAHCSPTPASTSTACHPKQHAGTTTSTGGDGGGGSAYATAAAMTRAGHTDGSAADSSNPMVFTTATNGASSIGGSAAALSPSAMSCASIRSRRRSSRSGDLATYIPRCKWCVQKLNKSHVSIMRLLCEGYQRLCQIIHEHRALYESTSGIPAQHSAATTAPAGRDRKTRSKDARGDFYFLARLVDESVGVPGTPVRLEPEELPSGVPADDMFSGQYLRLKAASAPDDRRLLDITAIASMYRYNLAPAVMMSLQDTSHLRHRPSPADDVLMEECVEDMPSHQTTGHSASPADVTRPRSQLDDSGERVSPGADACGKRKRGYGKVLGSRSDSTDNASLSDKSNNTSLSDKASGFPGSRKRRRRGRQTLTGMDSDSNADQQEHPRQLRARRHTAQ